MTYYQFFRKHLEWIWDIFKPSPNMSSYLVAVVVTELAFKETSYLSIDGRNVSIRLWTHQHQFDQLNFGISLVPTTLTAFENYLKIPFSLPQLDIIAVSNINRDHFLFVPFYVFAFIHFCRYLAMVVFIFSNYIFLIICITVIARFILHNNPPLDSAR